MELGTGCVGLICVWQLLAVMAVFVLWLVYESKTQATERLLSWVVNDKQS